MNSVTLHYTESVVRRAVGAFWWRTTGWRHLFVLGLMLAMFARMVWLGERSWWVGLTGGVLAICMVMATVLYFVHYRGAFARFRRMRVPEATLELGEDRFCIASDVGRSELAWSVVTELWQFPDFWLLFFSRAQFVTLPTADLDVTAREFIVAKLGAHAVKIA